MVNSQSGQFAVVDNKSLSLDHIEEFKKYVLCNIGNSDIVQSELNNIFS